MFYGRGFHMPDGGVSPAEPLPTPQQLANLRAEPVVAAKPATCLHDLFFVSGAIPRITA